MKIVRQTIVLLASVCCLLGIGLSQAQAQTTLQHIKKSGQVRIGMLVDFPPYGILNEQNKPDGYDADVAKLFAKRLGVKLKLVQVTGPNRIPYLLGGRVDLLIASLGITPARAKKVDYSQPYAAITVYLYGDKGVDIPNAKAMKGKTIAVARGSTQDTAVTKIAPKGTNIQRYDSDSAAVQALITGQAQALGCSGTVIHHLKQVAPGRFNKKFILNQQVQGIAVRPGDDKLRARINRFLKHIKKNGQLNKIHQKWLHSPLPEVLNKHKDIPDQQ